MRKCLRHAATACATTLRARGIGAVARLAWRSAAAGVVIIAGDWLGIVQGEAGRGRYRSRWLYPSLKFFKIEKREAFDGADTGC